MTRIVTALLLAGVAGAVGCSGGSPPPNTAPLTPEQKAKIQSEDKQVEEAERSGSGTATPRRRR